LPSFETADPAIAPELAIGPRRRNDDVTVKVDAQDPEAFRRLYETDIVRGGLFVPTTVHADLQTRVIIQMMLPEPFEPIELESFVVHQSPDPPGFGVQLANLDDVRSKIEPILQRLAGV
jgi:Tfp pilus assembly protein PilZ